MYTRYFREPLEEDLRKRKEYLETLIMEKQQALKHAPEGHLRCTTSSGHRRYYLVAPDETKKRSYIRKKDERVARALAQKEYDRMILEAAIKELGKIGELLNTQNAVSVDTLYEKLPDFRKHLVDPIVPEEKEYLSLWSSEAYERKEFERGYPEFYTQKGERVRSKSEIMIADTLGRYQVPYRYEYPLELPGFGLVHPDFTVLTVKRQEMIWEHLGMMDSPDYAARAIRRIEVYEQAGFFPGKRLILTHVTSSRPLGTKMIEAVIREYLV